MGLMCTSFTIIPAVQTGNSKAAVAVSPLTITDSSFAGADAAAIVYNTVNLQEYGLSEEAFNYAWKGYQKLLTKKMISRSNYLTICDFSQSSKQKRLYNEY